MRPVTLSLFAACMLAIVGCGGLPGDFAQLSLKEQVTAYEKHLEGFGRPQLYAQSHIAWHGWEAAELMARDLEGKGIGLPRYEAIQIISLVQLRGCSLRGTRADSALVNFLATGRPDESERQAAESALDSIRRNIIELEGPDSLSGGPCNTH
jgi:hypothetical protein